MIEWQPSADSNVAQRRAELMTRTREYFRSQDVLSVDTPAMGPYPSSDPNIDSFPVPQNSGRDAWLQTSPESFMKRLLASGYPDIYSICRVFRNGEIGRRHNPEFTLIEWYRLGFDLDAIIKDTVALLATCLEAPQLVSSVESFEYAEAFERFAHIDVFNSSAGEIAAQLKADADLQAALGENKQDWLDLAISEFIAPCFTSNQLTVIRHYPADQAALARICPNDSRVADRFEVFYGGLELANGYVELTDAAEQRRRFESAVDEQYVDEALLAAMSSGLPECAGVAVGLERLHMALDQTDDIRNVITFGAISP